MRHHSGTLKTSIACQANFARFFAFVTIKFHRMVSYEAFYPLVSSKSCHNPLQDIKWAFLFHLMQVLSEGNRRITATCKFCVLDLTSHSHSTQTPSHSVVNQSGGVFAYFNRAQKIED